MGWRSPQSLATTRREVVVEDGARRWSFVWPSPQCVARRDSSVESTAHGVHMATRWKRPSTSSLAGSESTRMPSAAAESTPPASHSIRAATDVDRPRRRGDRQGRSRCCARPVPSRRVGGGSAAGVHREGSAGAGGRRPRVDGDVPVSAETAERDLELLGLLALEDPPRADVREAIESSPCRIKVAMVTGTTRRRLRRSPRRPAYVTPTIRSCWAMTCPMTSRSSVPCSTATGSSSLGFPQRTSCGSPGPAVVTSWR